MILLGNWELMIHMFHVVRVVIKCVTNYSTHLVSSTLEKEQTVLIRDQRVVLSAPWRNEPERCGRKGLWKEKDQRKYLPGGRRCRQVEDDIWRACAYSIVLGVEAWISLYSRNLSSWPIGRQERVSLTVLSPRMALSRCVLLHSGSFYSESRSSASWGPDIHNCVWVGYK